MQWIEKSIWQTGLWDPLSKHIIDNITGIFPNKDFPNNKQTAFIPLQDYINWSDHTGSNHTGFLFKASYVSITNTGQWDIVFKKEFSTPSDYEKFLEDIHAQQIQNEEIQVNDPLLDISMREQKKSNIITQYQINQHYDETIQKLQSLQNFFEQHNITWEAEAIQKRIELIKQKINTSPSP